MNDSNMIRRDDWLAIISGLPEPKLPEGWGWQPWFIDPDDGMTRLPGSRIMGAFFATGPDGRPYVSHIELDARTMNYNASPAARYDVCSVQYEVAIMSLQDLLESKR